MKKLVGFLVAFLLAPSICGAMDLSDLRDRVRLYVRDTCPEATCASGVRYTNAQLNARINDVQKQVNADVFAVENTTSYLLTAGVTYYSLPTDYMGATRATFTDKNSHTFQLRMYSEKNIVDNTPDYERSERGQPTRFFTRISQDGDAPMEVSYLPVATTSSTGTVTVSYVAIPTDLSSDSDVPFNSYSWLVPYHKVIAYGVAYEIKMIENRFDEAKEYMGLFVAEESRMKAGLGGSPAFKPTAGVGGGP